MAYTTIDDPSAHFQTKIYTGNGTDSTAYTFDGNSSMQPDLLWFKSRSITEHHMWIDSTRGVSNKWLGPSDSGAEGAATQGYIESFDSDGWTSKDGTSGSNPNKNNNKSSTTYVTWGWKTNGGTRTTNTESGNNPAGGYQANTTAGFSIVDYVGTGATGTMAHGLGAVPQMIIYKDRSETAAWIVYHHVNGNGKSQKLNTTDAVATESTLFNDTTPTSSVFTIGSANNTNKNDNNFIAYCFTPIQGYSKFGSYTGNGNADGPFIYTGFKPAWIMQKNTADSTNWNIHDNKRSTFNNVDDILMANATDAEGAVGGKSIDFLSNGFKLRGNDNETNDNTDVHIYMTFAEHPFVSSEGVPTTAR